MAFMEPQYDNGPFEVFENDNCETFIVPAGTFSASYLDYMDLSLVDHTLGKWYYRLSASGYMDCTEWTGPFATEEEARDDLSSVSTPKETKMTIARRNMKNFDSRVFGICDFVEWDKNDQLVLNPTFQRRNVWSDRAKSFLIDTILRGKPIPKFFIRQTINVTSKSSVREVVDGQQRLRTILSFVKDGFVVSRAQNKEFGGKRFSQLPEDAQSAFLSYEVAVDLLINLPNEEVLDIFSRLNLT